MCNTIILFCLKKSAAFLCILQQTGPGYVCGKWVHGYLAINKPPFLRHKNKANAKQGINILRCIKICVNVYMYQHKHNITMESEWVRWLLKHQLRHCLLNRLFRSRSKKTSKLRVTGPCAGNSTVTGEFPHKGPVTGKWFHLMTSSWTTKKRVLLCQTLRPTIIRLGFHTVD